MTAEKILPFEEDLNSKNQIIALVAEDCVESAIVKLSEKYRGLKATDKESFEVVKKALRDVVTRRTSIDKRRLSLKRDIDEEAARLTLLLQQVELPLKSEKDKFDAILKAEAEAKAQIEKIRVEKIKARIAGFSSYCQNIMAKTSFDLQEDLSFFKACVTPDTFNYEEFINDAEKAKFETEVILTKAYNERKALEDREAAIAQRQVELDRQAEELARKAIERQGTAPEENVPDFSLQQKIYTRDIVQIYEPQVEIKPVAKINKIVENNDIAHKDNAIQAAWMASASIHKPISLEDKIQLLVEFIQQLISAEGKYEYLACTPVIVDAMVVLNKIGIK